MRGDRDDLERLDRAALHIFFWFTFLFLALCGGGALKPDDLNDDAVAIREAIGEFAVAFNEGNLQKFMDVFSENFVSMEYGRRTVFGKEALEEWRSYVQELFTKYDRHLEITTDEIRISGAMGFERGSVKVLLNPKCGGEARTEEHRFLDVWEKRNGQWKIVQAMSNK